MGTYIFWQFLYCALCQQPIGDEPIGDVHFLAVFHLPPLFSLCALRFFCLINLFVQSTPCRCEAFSRAINTRSNLRLLRFCKPFFICHRQRRSCRLPTSHAQLVKHINLRRGTEKSLMAHQKMRTTYKVILIFWCAIRDSNPGHPD